MTAEGIAKALGGSRTGAGLMARCPAHDDREPSLSIRQGEGDKALVRCHAGCAATFLRKVGIEVTFGREGRARTRTIRLTAEPESGGARPSTPSALPVSNIAPLRSNGLSADAARTVANPADDCEADPLTSVRSNPLKNNSGTVADDADANGARRSGPVENTGAPWRGRL
jgi:hypothetical protein